MQPITFRVSVSRHAACIVGGGAGIVAAPLIDAFALAYEPKPKASAGAFAAPTVSWVPGGASVGLAGQF